MKKITLGIVLMLGMAAFAQDKAAANEGRFQLGLHYNPNIEGHVEGYNVIVIGIDARVRFISFGKVNLNAGLSATVRTDNEPQTSNTIIWNPNVYAEFSVFEFPLKPYLGVGYDFYTYKLNYNVSNGFVPDFGDDSFAPSEKINYSGFNINPGIRFYFAKIMYADLGFNYLSVSAHKNDPYYGGNLNSKLLNIGIGFRF